MRFLLIQIIIIVLLCVFIAALSNLTELGMFGWIIVGFTGHALYKTYKHLYYNPKTDNAKRKCPSCGSGISDLSHQIQSFMFDDVTGLRDE